MKRIRRFQNSFTVRRPVAETVEFHLNPASMKRITPPPVLVQIHKAPQRITEGEEMEFTLWIGPFPLRWLACFKETGPAGFTDRQVRGPFELWEHRHSFESLDEETSRVVDSIQVCFHDHPFWKAVGWFLWLNLPVLFFYRQLRTRQLLEKKLIRGATANE